MDCVAKTECLAPTKEMVEQSELWRTGDEDQVIVRRLYQEIFEEAKRLGFNGNILVYTAPNDGEVICEVYASERDEELANNGDVDAVCDTVGYPVALINAINGMMAKTV